MRARKARLTAPPSPTPRVVTATEAQTRFGALLRRVCREGQHVIVERAGLPVVAILPLRDYEALRAAQPEAGGAPAGGTTAP